MPSFRRKRTTLSNPPSDPWSNRTTGAGDNEARSTQPDAQPSGEDPFLPDRQVDKEKASSLSLAGRWRAFSTANAERGRLDFEDPPEPLSIAFARVSRLQLSSLPTKAVGEQKRVVLATCQAILQDEAAAASDAAAVLEWICNHDLPCDGGHREGLERLASLRESNQGDPIRKQSAIKSIVLEWGWDVVSYYNWLTLGREIIAKLKAIAQALPSWQVFVEFADCVMIQRHDKEGEMAKRIGQTFSSSQVRGALQTGDIIEIHRHLTKGTSPVDDYWRDRVARWLRPHKPFALGTCESSDAPFASKAIGRDPYGMLCDVKTNIRHECDDECRQKAGAVRQGRRKDDEARRKQQKEREDDEAQRKQQEEREDVEARRKQQKEREDDEARRKQQKKREDDEKRKRRKQKEQKAQTEEEEKRKRSEQEEEVEKDRVASEARQREWAGEERKRGGGNALQCAQCRGDCALCLVPSCFDAATCRDMYYFAHSARSHRLTGVSRLWLSMLRFANVHDTEQGVDCAQPSQDHADAIVTTAAGFQGLVASCRDSTSRLIYKPIVIRGDGGASGVCKPAEFADNLMEVYRGIDVDVRVDDDPVPRRKKMDDVVQRLQSESKAEYAEVWNVLNLPDLANLAQSSISKTVRFDRLRKLLLRCEAKAGSGVGKVPTSRYLDVSSCLNFSILGFAGAFSGAHVDVLRGTWVRCLFGTRLWWIVPRHEMEEEDWREFAEQGHEWNPRGKGRALLLRQGDTLVMNDLIIHAVMTLDTSAMVGGMFWDEGDLAQLIRDLDWIRGHESSSNETMTAHLPALIRELEEMVGTDGASGNDIGAVKQAFQTFRQGKRGNVGYGPAATDRTAKRARM